MSKPSGHRDCRTRELLLALTADDVRQALEEASGDELAPALNALGVQSRSAGRKVPQLLRTRLRALGHDASHDVACFLTQPATRFLEGLLPDDGDLELQLLAGPLDALRRKWPPGMVRLTLEVLWHLGDLTTDQRDRLLVHEENVEPGPAVAAPAPPAAPAPVPLSVVPAPPVASALDDLLAEAVVRARSAPAGLGPVGKALEEVLALDSSRIRTWQQYGLAVVDEGRLADPTVLRPVSASSRRAFLLGSIRALAEAGDNATLTTLTDGDRAGIEDLLASADGAAVAAAVVSAHLHDARTAAQLLGAMPVPCEGWARLAGEVRRRVADLVTGGAMVEAELLLRGVEDALWRWGPEFTREATAFLLLRVTCRRGRSDFVGAGRLLASVDEGCLDERTRAVVACEQALVGAEIPGPEAVRFPSGEADWARLADRLHPVRRHLVDALEADPSEPLPHLLVGMLLYAEGDTSAAAVLARARATLDDRPELAVLARQVRFHAALARLRLLEPGTDDAAYRELAAAIAEGFSPGAEDLAAAVVALEAHGSPHAGSFLTAALTLAPAAPELVRLVAQRARMGDAEDGRTAENVARDQQLPLSVRFELLDAALDGAGVRLDVEGTERLAAAIDDVLARAGDPGLDERFADALGRNETLRLALDPASADALRMEVLRRIGRIDEARAIATALFYRAAGGSLRAFDPGDLFHVLVELGLPQPELDDLARLLPSPPDGEEPAAILDDDVRVLFVGGNETQDRYRAAVEAAVDARFGGRVSIDWFLSGWRSNWQTDAARVEGSYGQADVVVLMTFVRTHLGQRIRRTAGEHGLPWVACTGHGREAIERAVDRAVAVVSERRRTSIRI